MISAYYEAKFASTPGGKMMFMLIEKYLNEADQSGLGFDALERLVDETFDEVQPPSPALFGKCLREKIAKELAA